MKLSLILNPKFKEYLHLLEKTSIEGIRLQAREIEELFKDLEHMLYVLDLYIKNLKEIILNHPEQWSKKADQLVLMIDQKFGNERGELRKEFQIALIIPLILITFYLLFNVFAFGDNGEK